MEIGRHLAPGRTLCDQSSAYDRNGGFVAIFAALSDKAKGRAKREEVLEPGSEGKLNIKGKLNLRVVWNQAVVTLARPRLATRMAS